MPQTLASSQGISNIVDQMCGVGVVAGNQPSSITEATAADPSESHMDEVDSLQQLQIALYEGDDKTAETKELMQDSLSLIPVLNRDNIASYARKALHTSRCDYRTLNAEENSRLSILTQISCYANFLQNQENDGAHGDRREKIKDVRLRLVQIGRHLRQLLPLTNEEIKNYVVSGNENYGFPLGNTMVSALRRAVCCIVIDLILTTIRNITVSVDTGSVTMA